MNKNIIYSFAAAIMFLANSVAQAVDTEVVWIDVRTPAEFASGHIPGSVNIEFQDIATRITEITENKQATIKLYCKSGRRSGVAKQTLLKMGYEKSQNIGSYAAALAHVANLSSKTK